MRLIMHREIPVDETLARDWNALVQCMEKPEIFHTYEWALAIHRAYGSHLSPLVLLAYEGNSLVGICAASHIPSRRELTFLASGTADYCDFICHPSRRLEFFSIFLQELEMIGVRHITLANWPAESVDAIFGHSLAASGYSSLLRPAYRCAQIDLSSQTQKDAVRQAVSQKQVLRRDLKAMSKLGRIELLHLRSWDDISVALPAFEQAHIHRFRRQGKVSPFLQPERARFIVELTRLLVTKGWVTLSCLTLAGRPVAWNYGFEFSGSLFWYQPAFEVEFTRYSPGSCLLARVVLDACGRSDLHRVDLGLGDEGYKARFATSYRPTMHVILTASPVRYLRERLRHQAASAIKSAPRVEGYLRRVLSHWHAESRA